MARRARTFTAAMLLLLPAGVGLGASPAHAVVEVSPTEGGCWTYVPDRPAVDPAAPAAGWSLPGVAEDAVQPFQAWASGADATRLTLETSGATVKDLDRTFRLGVVNGPVLDEALPVAGSATAVFSLQTAGATEEITASVPFLVDAGERVGPLEIDGVVPIAGEGDHVLQLESLYFDAPSFLGPGTVTACNGQPGTEPSAGDGMVPGVNPATTPLAVTGLEETFVGYEARALGLDAVRGQQAGVTSHARGGDGLAVRATGLDTGEALVAELCAGPALTECVQSAPSEPAGSDGTATTTVTLPGDVRAGDAVLRVPDRADFPELDLAVLAAPTAEVTEKVGEEELTATLAGTGWDPGATVVVAGVAAGAASADGPTEVAVRPDGSFDATYVATDSATTALSVTQERPDGFAALTTRHDLRAAVPGPVDTTPPDGEEPKEEDPPVPADPPVTAPPTSSTPTLPSAAPAVDIPLPGEVPVNDVPAPLDGTGTEGTEALKVSEAHLRGEASWSEMFGGSSRRDVTFLAENTGETTIANPLVRLGVGRTADVDPAIVAAEVGELPPGARVAVAVDVALPMASFGVYQVVGQVGDAEENRFALEWQTYPWGLIALNLMGVALLVWGVARRQRQRNAPAPLVVGADDEAGASVVDLTALDRWWATGKVTPRVEEDDNDSIVDLEAADRWWAKRGSQVS